MKKIILLICLMVFALNESMAQSQWSFGPRLGIGFSNRAEGFDYCNHFVG